jgi:uncharacterized protein YkwD
MHTGSAAPVRRLIMIDRLLFRVLPLASTRHFVVCSLSLLLAGAIATAWACTPDPPRATQSQAARSGSAEGAQTPVQRPGAAAPKQAAAPSPTRDEQAIVDLINASRAKRELPVLNLAPELIAYARSHSARMAEQGDIFHDPSRVRQVFARGGWQRYAENVGMGPSPADVHDALMRSRGHRANILGDFTHVAAGAQWDDSGNLYVTEVFGKKPPPRDTTTSKPTGE